MSTLGEKNVDNVPNWEAVDFVEGDFSHIEENYDDEHDPTFYGLAIDPDRTQIYIDLIYWRTATPPSSLTSMQIPRSPRVSPIHYYDLDGLGDLT
jgi:hypothetical protein